MCKHEYEPKSHHTYNDYSGFRVIVIYYVCKICGRKRKRKFF